MSLRVIDFKYLSRFSLSGFHWEVLSLCTIHFLLHLFLYSLHQLPCISQLHLIKHYWFSFGTENNVLGA